MVFGLIKVGVAVTPAPDAEDPDLDALLADLCQLEEDTKAQLASSNSVSTEKLQDTENPLR